MTERQQKTDAELREDVNRLRKRIRHIKLLPDPTAELANCMLGLLDLLTDAGLGQP